METKSHCPFCGDPLGRKFVEGNHRLFCNRCNRPIYENPIPATCVIVSDDHSHLVLVKRSVPPKEGWWCLPGGFIELGEDPEAGALRELAEETGLIAATASLIGVCTTPSPQYHSVLMVSYAVTEFHGRLRPGDDAGEAQWFPHDRLPAIAFDSHEYFIDLFFNGKPYPAFRVSLKDTPRP